MEKKQESVQATITALRPLSLKYQSLIATVPALKDLIDELFSTGDELSIKIGTQNANLKGITKEKKELKLLLSEETEIVAGAIYNLAVKKNNTPLATEMDTKTYKILKLKDEIIVPIVLKVFEVAKFHLTDLNAYGITQLKLDDYKLLIDNFAEKRQMPKVTISEKHSQTTAIANLCKRAIDILAKIDKLMLQFKKTNTEFYDNYMSARKIEKTGSRKSNKNHEEVFGIINITLKDSITKNPIANADAIIDNTDFTDTSDEDGMLYFDKVAIGIANISISAEGYNDLQIKNLQITKDTDLSLDYEMVAIMV